MDAVKAAGLGYTVQEGDPFTQEAYDAYYNEIEALWASDVQGIVDYVYDTYAAAYGMDYFGRTAEEIAAKVPAGAESVFVRVDQNKLWWIKGEETGSVDIWE